MTEYKGLLKRSLADQDTLIECDQMRFLRGSANCSLDDQDTKYDWIQGSAETFIGWPRYPNWMWPNEVFGGSAEKFIGRPRYSHGI